ncbi:MAG TPA: hypothetical protein DCX53_00730 [Anaerolineae bacterium]|nr:hypothetical protein [Anaerolineae bacterium]
MNTTFDNTQSLTETLITELTKAFAFSQNSHAKQWIRFFFGKAAGNAARLGVGLDKAVAEGGIYGGARWLLPRFVKSHEARGQELIPTSGPLGT